MANLLSYDASQLLGFILVLVRVGGIVGTAPIIGSINTPMLVKVLLSFSVAMLLHPFLPKFAIPLDDVNYFLILVGGELMIGMLLGLVGKFLFEAISVAGELTGFTMGLSMAQAMDPTTGQQKSIISQFERMLASLIFLVMDAHHVIINAIVASYRVITPGQFSMTDGLARSMIDLSANIFVLGFQLGAPLIVALFLTNLIMGLAARSVPQMNIFVVGFPLSIMLGLLFIYMGLPIFLQAVRGVFELYDDQIMSLFPLMKAAP